MSLCPNHRCYWVLVALSTLLASCAGKEQGGGPGKKDKKAYEQAASDVGDMVGVISAFMPFIHPVKEKGKYAPKRRPDLDKAATVAANHIRSAANRARLKAERSKTVVSMELTKPFIGVIKACTNAEDPEALGKCDGSIKALKKALEAVAKEAKALGVQKFPTIGPDAIGKVANDELSPYRTAIGGGKLEQTYFAMRKDPKATPGKIINACRAAERFADTNAKSVERVSEPIRKLAIHHKLAIESQCNKLSGADIVHKGLDACKKDDKSPECKLACAKAKAVMNFGVPAAAFIPFETDYAETCEEDDKKKKK